MLRLFDLEQTALSQQKKRPDLVDQRGVAEPLIRRYFDGGVSDLELYRLLHGHPGRDLVRVTRPSEDFWPILMAALDVVIGMHVATAGVKRLSHGCVTLDEYVEAVRSRPKKDRYGW